MKLANNESEKSSPKVSKLPLPISDSPLVIDLPDGQKIVVGKMTLGSVIEVATWRGVGRPDSRTSRLMLGMGSGNVNEESDSGESTQSPGQKSAPVKPKGFAGFVFTFTHFAKNLNRINWSGTFRALFAYLASKKNHGKKSKNQSQKISAGPASSTPEIKQTVALAHTSEDADIEEWLNKISKKASRESARTRVPSQTAQPNRVKSKAPAKKVTSKPANSRTSKKS